MREREREREREGRMWNAIMNAKPRMSAIRGYEKREKVSERASERASESLSD